MFLLGNGRICNKIRLGLSISVSELHVVVFLVPVYAHSLAYIYGGFQHLVPMLNVIHLNCNSLFTP